MTENHHLRQVFLKVLKIRAMTAVTGEPFTLVISMYSSRCCSITQAQHLIAVAQSGTCSETVLLQSAVHKAHFHVSISALPPKRERLPVEIPFTLSCHYN